MKRIVLPSYTKEQSQAFLKTFGETLHRYWHPLYGFEITKFDDEVIKSGDESMAETIRKNYGKRAENLVRKLNALHVEVKDETANSRTR